MVQEVRLKLLLRQRHWQTYQTFRREYDKAATTVDRALVGTGPSRAQLHRWLSGELKGLPYPDHCRVLEQMFPGWRAGELFERCDAESQSSSSRSGERGGLGALVDMIENRIDMQDSTVVTWGPRDPEVRRLGLLPQVDPTKNSPSHNDLGDIVGRRLLELKDARRLTDEDVSELSNSAGHVVELSESIDIEIELTGDSIVTYRMDLLNLTNKPLARVPREIGSRVTRAGLCGSSRHQTTSGALPFSACTTR